MLATEVAPSVDLQNEHPILVPALIGPWRREIARSRVSERRARDVLERAHDRIEPARAHRSAQLTHLDRDSWAERMKAIADFPLSVSAAVKCSIPILHTERPFQP